MRIYEKTNLQNEREDLALFGNGGLAFCEYQLKAEIRKQENIKNGDTITFSIEIRN
ncbi:hypothetical protein HY249_03175 [Candidatus Azambacteria bacterium]|nr:hypothetical protein [Candidatus Azambacteria bacterium]